MLLEGRIEAKRVEFGEIRSSFDTLRHGNAVPSLLNLRCQFHILFNPRSLENFILWFRYAEEHRLLNHLQKAFALSAKIR